MEGHNNLVGMLKSHSKFCCCRHIVIKDRDNVRICKTCNKEYCNICGLKIGIECENYDGTVIDISTENFLRKRKK